MGVIDKLKFWKRDSADTYQITDCFPMPTDSCDPATVTPDGGGDQAAQTSGSPDHGDS